jgi:hypothetical protein
MISLWRFKLVLKIDNTKLRMEQREFLDGKLRFRSLSYFRDYEDEQVRGDKNEGKMVFSPEGGLALNNQTQGYTSTIPWSLPQPYT